MLLNTKIFNDVIEAAKAKCAGNEYMLRAIERAARELNRSRYWAYDAATNVLKIQSTTSRKLYVVDDAHTCEAKTVCKHAIARRLMKRYTEALKASVVEGRQIETVVGWHAEHGYQKRAQLEITTH